MDTELAGRGCSIRRPGLALWALGSTHRAQEKFGDQEPGREFTLQMRRTVTSGRRQYARCPLGFLLPTGIRSQRVKVALPASSLFLQVSDTGPTHESPFRFCPHSESPYCCFPAPACHLIRKFLLDTGSWEDFSDISGQMLTESSLLGGKAIKYLEILFICILSLLICWFADTRVSLVPHGSH